MVIVLSTDRPTATRSVQITVDLCRLVIQMYGVYATSGGSHPLDVRTVTN